MVFSKQIFKSNLKKKQNKAHSPWPLANKNIAKISSIRWYHVTDKNPAVVKETKTDTNFNLFHNGNVSWSEFNGNVSTNELYCAFKVY